MRAADRTAGPERQMRMSSNMSAVASEGRVAAGIPDSSATSKTPLVGQRGQMPEHADDLQSHSIRTMTAILATAAGKPNNDLHRFTWKNRILLSQSLAWS